MFIDGGVFEYVGLKVILFDGCFVVVMLNFVGFVDVVLIRVFGLKVFDFVMYCGN